MDASAFIRTYLQQIVTEWARRVAALPGEQRLSPPSLLDHLPEVILRLADWIDAPTPENAEKFSRMATHHGLQRLSNGLELRQIIGEYRILRATMLELIERHLPGEALQYAPRLCEGLDHAIADCVDAYASAFERARERFVDMLAHDLRSPLFAISMGASLLSEGQDHLSSQEIGERIKRSTRRMQGLIDDMLDFARGRHGAGIPVKLTDADMAAICKEVVDEAHFAHRGRTIRFEGEGDLRGHWDADRVQQAITNLVSNALQHGKDPIVVRAQDQDHEVVVTVANGGPPIDPSQLPTLFEPYQLGTIAQPDGAPRASVGLGLGLFIVREIVRAHHGKVSVQSDERGTEFVTRWPRRCDA